MARKKRTERKVYAVRRHDGRVCTQKQPKTSGDDVAGWTCCIVLQVVSRWFCAPSMLCTRPCDQLSVQYLMTRATSATRSSPPTPSSSSAISGGAGPIRSSTSSSSSSQGSWAAAASSSGGGAAGPMGTLLGSRQAQRLVFGSHHAVFSEMVRPKCWYL